MGIEITVNMNKGNEKPEMDDEMEDAAEAGRNGDDVMGHLTRGEIVIPVPLAEKLGPMLAEEFKKMDLDINQYIVGNPKNSINPETKCPEFGWKKFVGKVVAPVTKALNVVDKAIGTNLIPDPPKGPSTEELAAEAAAIKKLQDEEAAIKKTTAETDAQAKALAQQMEQEKALAAQQTAKMKTESEGIQRETAERRLARLRARKRSGSRPMLSRGVSLKGEA